MAGGAAGRAEGGERAAPEHGGDLGAARRLFPGAPEPWLDLSTGINPVPYPLPAIDPEAWTRLPAPGDLAALEAVAAAAYGSTDPAHLVAAPGTGALIALLPRLRSTPARVAVVGPTYAEHAAAWRAGGHAVEIVADLVAAEAAAEVVVLANPNNPDGRVHPRPALAALGRRLARRDGLLVVDEAFADFDGAQSLLPRLPGDLDGAGGAHPPSGTLVLRSFGKAYGLAGLRLGFAAAEPGMAAALRAGLGPWAVSGPAIAVGRAALADRAWRAAAEAARRADAVRLQDLLVRAGADPVGGTALFRTVSLGARTPAVFAGLGRAGIWVRRFRERPDWLRFGLPPGESAWARLAAGLDAAMA